MNNEIGRKLTSLTLMTIMLAGGMTIAAPSMMPQAAAAGQLYVSAENADFNNFFAGAQVVEIIVKDPNRIDTDEAESEPTVRVNEFPVRMVQGADGYWYAYIVESNEIAAADANANLEYGTAQSVSGLTFNAGIVSTYTSTSGTAINVISNPPSLSPKNSGQIGLNTSAEWPFIQTLDLTLETIEIRYEQPGPDEVLTLKHDNDDIDDFAGIEIDRSGAHNNSHVHLTITDQALNLDPTAEDVVMFRVDAGSEGVSFNHATSDTAGAYNSFSNGFDDNGVLKINYDAGTQSGKRFRLRGKGMPGLRGTSRGDAYVETLVETPVNLTKRQKDLLKEFSADGKSRGPQTDSFSEKLKRFWSGN